ncbi:hypothetical protein, partial [Bradyrhizobium sp.]|uniref:hypothetical protein n=1 Tax=Bradyrhizobium sp. TaxID=376 RepID=UPI0025B8140F
MPLRNPLELFDRNSGAKFLMSAPKPKQREVRSGSKPEVELADTDFRFAPQSRHPAVGPHARKGRVEDGRDWML